MNTMGVYNCSTVFLYAGFETWFGWDSTYRCWDPIAKHISTPDFGTILIHALCLTGL